MGGQELGELSHLALLGAGLEVKVGAVKAGGEGFRLGHRKGGQDVGAGAVVGSRGEGDARHAGQAVGQAGQQPVFGAEFVAPGGNAVGLVDGDQRQGTPAEAFEQGASEEAFGGHVQEFETAVRHLVAGGGLGVLVEFGVQGGGFNAELAEGSDLVVHQGDERRDDQAHAVAAQRGQLVAEALAATGGHEHQRVAARHDTLDAGRLQTAKAAKAEHPAEDLLGRTPGGRLRHRPVSRPRRRRC